MASDEIRVEWLRGTGRYRGCHRRNAQRPAPDPAGGTAPLAGEVTAAPQLHIGQIALEVAQDGELPLGQEATQIFLNR